ALQLSFPLPDRADPGRASQRRPISLYGPAADRPRGHARRDRRRARADDPHQRRGRKLGPGLPRAMALGSSAVAGLAILSLAYPSRIYFSSSARHAAVPTA